MDIEPTAIQQAQGELRPEDIPIDPEFHTKFLNESDNALQYKIPYNQPASKKEISPQTQTSLIIDGSGAIHVLRATHMGHNISTHSRVYFKNDHLETPQNQRFEHESYEAIHHLFGGGIRTLITVFEPYANIVFSAFQLPTGRQIATMRKIAEQMSGYNSKYSLMLILNNKLAVDEIYTNINDLVAKINMMKSNIDPESKKNIDKLRYFRDKDGFLKASQKLDDQGLFSMADLLQKFYCEEFLGR